MFRAIGLRLQVMIVLVRNQNRQQPLQPFLSSDRRPDAL